MEMKKEKKRKGNNEQRQEGKRARGVIALRACFPIHQPGKEAGTTTTPRTPNVLRNCFALSWLAALQYRQRKALALNFSAVAFGGEACVPGRMLSFCSSRFARINNGSISTILHAPSHSHPRQPNLLLSIHRLSSSSILVHREQVDMAHSVPPSALLCLPSPLQYESSRRSQRRPLEGLT